MASLYNPLDNFASYSVHYVMLAARTTEEAKVFTDEANNAATLAAIEQVTILGEPIPYGTGNTAFLVMDTRRFSQFTIDRLKYDVWINGIEKSGSTGNFSTIVEMTILDSVGISFINFLQYLMDEKMYTNFDGMVYMLRVIFVGHTSDGKTETVQTVTIPMHLFKLELNLDYSKGAYTAEFMPNSNFDVTKHERWLNISTASSYFTGKENTLGGLVDSFEEALNDKSSEFYNNANNIVEAFKTGGRTKNNKFGRQVKYNITIPENWRKFTFAGAGTNASTETAFKRLLQEKEKAKSGKKEDKKDESKPGTPIDTNLSVDAGSKITDVLDLMFKQVPDISKLGAGVKGKDGVITFYKHFVGITSDENVVMVHVDVVKFHVPNVLLESKDKNQHDKVVNDFYETKSDGRRVPKNYAEFDYIFTGKNKDILNFDLKLQDLNWMLAQNLGLGASAMQGVTANGQNPPGPDVVNTQMDLVQARAYDPIFLPKNTDAELKNFTLFSSLLQKSEQGAEIISSSQKYTQNLSMFYAASPITAVITIRGNPDIMAKFNQSSFLPHIITSTNSGNEGNSATDQKAKDKYRSDFEKKILRDNQSTDGAGRKNADITRNDDGSFQVNRTLGDANYATSPVFVKINIKGPNVDFRTSDLVRGEDFAKEILYDNFYVVMKVSNIIEGASFTQQLELYSHNIFGQGKLTALSSDKGAKPI